MKMKKKIVLLILIFMNLMLLIGILGMTKLLPYEEISRRAMGIFVITFFILMILYGAVKVAGWITKTSFQN